MYLSPSDQGVRRRSSAPRLRRKPSRAFSVLTLGCASTQEFTPFSPLPTTEEHIFSDPDEKPNIPDAPPPIYTLTNLIDLPSDSPISVAYKAFLKEYPQYKLTWPLDALRRTDFSRLDQSGETYVDYMGGALYPDSLVRVHAAFLQRSVLGNTHSVNNS